MQTDPTAHRPATLLTRYIPRQRDANPLLSIPKMASPGGELPRRGCRLVLPCNSAKGPVSRILSCAVIPLGAALPRSLISDLPGGFDNCSSHLNASGRCAAPALLPARRFPPYLVLLRVGFTVPPALPPERCALTAPFHPYHCTGPASRLRVVLRPKTKGWQWRYLLCGTGRLRALKRASRTLSGTLPCGVRTFLPRFLLAETPAATAQLPCCL